MKKWFTALAMSSVFMSAAVYATITLEENGNIHCSGGCTTVVNPSAGTITVCQGSTCISTSIGGGGRNPTSDYHK